MFFRLYKYGLLATVRQKLTIFWNLIFPVVLGTLFQMTFGDGFIEEMTFRQIPVAYVSEEGTDTSFTELLNMLEEDSELIKVRTVGKKEAEELLRGEEVEGIFYQTKAGEITLTVTGQEINQSILSSILEQYEQMVSTLTNIGKENPAGLPAAVSSLEEEYQYLKEGSISDTPKHAMMDYFYSLIAMNCLMGATTGVLSASEFKADLSSLAARRVLASTNRFGILLADLASKITIQFACITFSICYLMYALHVSLGDKMGFILLTALVGSNLGVFLGFFIGTAGKLKRGTREGICIMIMMVSSFISGLMVSEMYRIVENYAPFIHLFNPASLIVKALRSLDIYETYDRYAQCMVSLLILTILLGIGAFVRVRRERYASL